MKCEISETERQRFSDVCREVLTLPKNTISGGAEGIGLLGEKRLHATLKRFICSDTSFHEQAPWASVKGGKKFVADILCENEIYEIQTGSMFPLQKKLSWYAENTDRHITVVHPISQKKKVIWIDPLTGDCSAAHTSPKKGKPSDILPDLLYISEFAAIGRVSVMLLMLETEEYRWQNGKRGGNGKRGSSRCEMLPVSLCEKIMLELPEDYSELLPDSLCASAFTAKDFAKELKLNSRSAYMAIKTLQNLGVVFECGNRGRAREFKLIQ